MITAKVVKVGYTTENLDEVPEYMRDSSTRQPNFGAKKPPDARYVQLHGTLNPDCDCVGPDPECPECAGTGVTGYTIIAIASSDQDFMDSLTEISGDDLDITYPYTDQLFGEDKSPLVDDNGLYVMESGTRKVRDTYEAKRAGVLADRSRT